jgi:drug/metabolite transporter (DMT)-like permease
MFKDKSPLLVWSIFGFLAIVWGSSFILMKKGLEAFTSSEVGALRIALAGLLMLPIAIKNRPKDLRKYLLGFTVVGCCGNLIPSFLFTAAETNISSGLAGMLNAFTPVFALIVGMIMFKNKTNQYQLAGLGLGFLGVIILLYQPNMAIGHLASVGMIIFATLLYGISVNSFKYFLSDLKSLTGAAWSISIVSVVAWVYLLGFTDVINKIQTVPNAMGSLGYVAILGIVGTAISTVIFYKLIEIKGSVFSTSVTYVIPIVAVAWGVLLKESLHWWQPAAMLVILAGVYLINQKKPS